MKLIKIAFFLFFGVQLIVAQEKIFPESKVSVKAEFPGGDKALHAFISKNYNGIMGSEMPVYSVALEFTVEKDGSLSGIEVMDSTKNNESGLENVTAEVARLLSISPKWKPAQVKGKTVRSRVVRSISVTGYLASTEAEDDNRIHTMAGIEVKPEFPGGLHKFYEFFEKNYVKPQGTENSRGRVYVTFVIETDGSLTDIRVIRDLVGGTGEEAVRVMKKCPNWLPGEMNGRKVRVQYSLPLRIGMPELNHASGTPIKDKN